MRRWMEAHRTKAGEILQSMFSRDPELAYLSSAPNEFWTGETLHYGDGAHVSEIQEYSSTPTLVKAWRKGDADWAT